MARNARRAALLTLVVVGALVAGGLGAQTPPNVNFPDETFPLGTLPPHSSITIELEVEIKSPLQTGASQVCNQGTVSGENPVDLAPFNVATDDPDLGGVADPTCTLLTPMDFGDAPDPLAATPGEYPTLAASDGARHDVGPELFLGACVDADAGGQPSAAADGDDAGAGIETEGTCAVPGDDEDGVTLPGLLIPGQIAAVDVSGAGSAGGGLLDAWVDFNGNGSWADLGEQVFADEPLVNGVNMLSFAVPGTATPGITTYARFRLSSAGVASFTGVAPDGEVEDYRVAIASPSIAVTKTAGSPSVAEPSGSVTFTVEVTNTGNVPVDLSSLNDDLHGDVAQVQGTVTATTCMLPQTIAALGSYPCQFTATVSGNDGEVVTDTVTASATPTGGGNTLMAADDASVAVTGAAPSLTVTKTPSAPSLPEPGGSVTFTVDVTNTSVSSDPVTLDTLTDSVHGDVTLVQGDVTATTCALPQTIASGDTYTCTFTADLGGNDGDVLNDTITASGQDDDGEPASTQGMASVTITGVAPAITVTKTPSVPSLPEPGGSVTFTLEVTNSSVSSDPVTLDTLTDSVHGDITQVQGDVTATTCAVPQGIQPGTSHTCTFTADLTANDGDLLTDTVTASGQDDDGEPASAQAMASVAITGVAPGISVTKTPDQASLPEPGGSVTFTLEVTNTSTAASDPVTIDTLTDSVHGDVTQVQGDVTATTCTVPQTLQPGDTTTCTFTADLTGNDGDVLADTVTASGQDDDGEPASAQAMASVTITGVAPAITVTKTPSPTSLPEPGGSVTFTLEVTNTSTAASDPVTLDTLTDDQHGDVTQVQGDVTATTCSVPQTLQPVETTTCTFTADLTGNDGDVLADTVTASGQDDDGEPASAQGMASVTITGVAPAITVTKTPSPNSLPEPGGSVTFTLEVTNTSTAASDPVTLDTLTDDQHGDVTQVQGDVTATTCAVPQTIQPGASYTCTFTADLIGSDGDVITDTVTAAGQDDDGEPASGQAQASVSITGLPSSISVTKTPDAPTVTEPGGAVTFTLEVTNTSPGDPVTIDSLTDSVHGDVTQVQGDVTATTCATPQTLQPGETYTCTFTADLSGTAGDLLADTVTAAGQDDDGEPVSGQGLATVGVVGTDFGDAADPSLPTLLASDGARHTIPAPLVLFLGASIDHETDGQPSAGADGDDSDGNDDEDGVVFTSQLVPGGTATLDVTASAPGLLDAWIDFNGNGAWADAGEQVFTGEPLTAGTNSLSYAVPAGAFASSEVAARFRLSGNGGLGYTGPAGDGEVEDYLVTTDTDPPQVTSVGTHRDTGDGELAECETARVEIGRLTVTFSEGMRQPEVTDPASYLLVDRGPDGSFDTASCAGGGAGDGPIPITGVTYDTATRTATLDPGTPLPDTQYRLLVCSSLTDLAGNPLDGDPGAPGSEDFVRSFRVDAGNLFANGHFDCDTGDWTEIPAGAANVGYASEDVDGSADSGSVTAAAIGAAAAGVEQCIDPARSSTNPHQLAGRFRIDAPAGSTSELRRSCEAFDGAACGGTSLAVLEQAPQLVTDTAGTWLPLPGTLHFPAGTASARCRFVVRLLGGGSPDVFFDALTLTGMDEIFTDGFESGDTSAWSSTVP